MRSKRDLNETQTRPKRDPDDTTNNTTNNTTNKNSPHANGTAAHPTTQDIALQLGILFDI